MKRISVFIACLTMAIAVSPAAAELIGTTTSGNIVVSYTWDDGNAAYDVIDIYLSKLTGAAEGSQSVGIEGAWRSIGGSFFVYEGDASSSTFKKHVSDYYGFSEAESWVNFFYNSSGEWARDGGATANSTLLQGAWYNGADSALNWAIGAGDTDEDDIAENQIAHLAVTKGTTEITFGGGPNDKIGYTYGGGTTEVTMFSVAKIPEPSSLVLLTCGLVGLLACAWRKRR